MAHATMGETMEAQLGAVIPVATGDENASGTGDGWIYKIVQPFAPANATASGSSDAREPLAEAKAASRAFEEHAALADRKLDRGLSRAEATPLQALAETRAASRALASKIPENIVARLFEEHGALVDKKLDCGLSRAEASRLAYVRWKLDRIEDAKLGGGLDTLEALAKVQESIASDIDRFCGQVEKMRRPRRKKR